MALLDVAPTNYLDDPWLEPLADRVGDTSHRLRALQPVGYVVVRIVSRSEFQPSIESMRFEANKIGWTDKGRYWDNIVHLPISLKSLEVNYSHLPVLSCPRPEHRSVLRRREEVFVLCFHTARGAVSAAQ